MSEQHPDCGTPRGHRRHIREGTIPCQACCDATARYARDWRLRTGRTKGVFIPRATIALYVTGVVDVLDD